MAQTRAVITDYVRRFEKFTVEKLNHVLKEVDNNKHTIRSICFVNCSLKGRDSEKKESEDLMKVMTSLQTLPLLTEIDLSSNCLYTEGAEMIAGFLPHFQKLRILNLSDNNIEFKGIKVLIDAASTLPHVFKLQLNHNKISLDEYQQLVKYVRKLSSSLILDIAYDIKDKLEVKKGATKFELDSVLHELKITPVKQLKIAECKVGDSEVKELVDVLESRQLTFIQDLDFSDNGITDVGADIIHHLRCQLPNLKINLKNNPISSRDIEYKSLATGVLAKAYAELAVYPVRKLKLINCNLSNYEVMQLIDFLAKEQASTLTEIDFSHNKITDMGAEALFNLMKKLPHLKVSIIGNPVSIRELECIGDLTTDDIADLMMRLSLYPISKLEISSPMSIPVFKKIMELIEANQLTTLTELDLSGMTVTVEHEELLLKLKEACPDLKIRLSSQNLEYKQMDCSGMRLTPILNKLKLYSVSKIKMTNCQLGDEEVQQLAVTIQKHQLKTLTHLDLSNGSEEVKTVSQFKNTIRDEGAIALSILLSSDLQSINLANNVIGDIGAVAIARLLIKSKLRLLDLSENEIFAEGLDALSAAQKCRLGFGVLKVGGNSAGALEAFVDIQHSKKALPKQPSLFALSTRLDLEPAVEDDFVLLPSP